MNKWTLVTGGLGYIGSHLVVELLIANEQVIVIDNLSNSDIEVLDRIRTITKRDPIFFELDVSNKLQLSKVFSEYDIGSVIHLAGEKAVAESVKNPLKYYRNNIGTTLSILEIINKHNTESIIFSSSATVYDHGLKPPYEETSKTGNCSNPYGWTKYINEQILRDFTSTKTGFSCVVLRYFNPVGAHSSGLLGENPLGKPNNLMPHITKVAKGEIDVLPVFGSDYPTPDGTGVRDYIHVVDLAQGHLQALNYARNHKGFDVFNLGSGTGFSVLEIIKAYENSTGQEIKFAFYPRRDGDVAISYADVSKAKRMLSWSAKKTLREMCYDSWNANPTSD